MRASSVQELRQLREQGDIPIQKLWEMHFELTIGELHKAMEDVGRRCGWRFKDMLVATDLSPRELRLTLHALKINQRKKRNKWLKKTLLKRGRNKNEGTQLDGS